MNSRLKTSSRVRVTISLFAVATTRFISTEASSDAGDKDNLWNLHKFVSWREYSRNFQHSLSQSSNC